MKKLCKRIITFSLVLCMALSVFTGVVYAKDTDTIVILYENDVPCAVGPVMKPVLPLPVKVIFSVR